MPATNYPTSVYSLTINRRTHDTIKSVDLKDLTVTAGGKNVAGLGEAIEHILDAAGLK